jgi:hypothetical protein
MDNAVPRSRSRPATTMPGARTGATAADPTAVHGQDGRPASYDAHGRV